MLRLASKTDARYVDVALADDAAVGALLVDHAHCEHKAAVTALSFVSKYPDDAVLVVALARLARDEAGHFAQMAEICTARGLSLSHPDKDAYVQRLLQGCRRPSVRDQRVDRLLACAFIEARSCERLQLLSDGFAARGHADLAAVYASLWKEEANHHALFVDLAARTASHDELGERLEHFARHEADVLASLPLRPAIH
jgi:tRNA-(ms[2]io[6]A)-hydroxylase